MVLSDFLFKAPPLVCMVSLGKLGKTKQNNNKKPVLPQDSLLRLSENDLNILIYLNKTLYCHLPDNFFNKYTNLPCP